MKLINYKALLIFFPLIIILISCNRSIYKKKNSVNDTNISTKDFIISDSTRIDPNYKDYRILNMRVWYPSTKNYEAKKSNTKYYYKINEAYAQLPNWSKSDVEQVNKIKTQSFKELTINNSEINYPLLIFSPSLAGNFSRYTFYFEELAKEGFIVAAINHKHESEFVIDKTRKVYPANLRFHDSLKNLKIPEEISAEIYRAAKDIRILTLAKDLIFSLDYLKLVNESEFNSKIDFSKVGVFGHSIGGAAAIYASYLDKRIKSVVNIDGTPPTKALNEGINVPFMLIEDLTDYKNHLGYSKVHKRRNDFCKINKEDSFRILLAETNHNSFLDINYRIEINLIRREQLGKPLKISRKYINYFFKTYLNDKNLSLREYRSDSLEVLVFKKP